MLGNGQTGLKAAQVRVVPADIPQERHKYIAAILFGSSQIGLGCLDLPSNAAEEVEFPGRIELASEIAEIESNGLGCYPSARTRQRSNCKLAVAGRGRSPVDLRIVLRFRQAVRGPRFIHTSSSKLEIIIRRDGALNQGIELGIFKRFPP